MSSEPTASRAADSVVLPYTSFGDSVAGVAVISQPAAGTWRVEAYDLDGSLSGLDPVALLASGRKPSRVFLFDTGATIHLTIDRYLLHNYVAYKPGEEVTIRGAFGGTGKAIGYGTMHAEMTLPNGRTAQVTFERVHYAPDLGHNLLSGFQLLAGGFTILGEDKIMKVLTPAPQQELIMWMPIDARAGCIPVEAKWEEPPPSALPVRALPINGDQGLLHKRLGHPGIERERAVAKGDAVTGLECEHSFADASLDCEDCARGRQIRSPVPKVAKNRASRPAERLHSDVWGKAPVVGFRGREIYAFAIVDDYSRMVFLQGLKTRDEVPRAIRDAVLCIEAQTGEKVLRFRRDGAKEYRSKEVDQFLRLRGIVAEDTIPYEHQQNGVVERRWRSLFETARTILLASHLPTSFWFLALSVAVYLHNRLPSKANGGVTPYERFYGKAPDLAHARPFGCVAHVLIDASRRNKLQPRTRRCAFVGYLNNSRGWLFWDPATRTFVEGAQVRFFESKFLPDDKGDEAAKVADWLRVEGVVTSKVERANSSAAEGAGRRPGFVPVSAAEDDDEEGVDVPPLAPRPPSPEPAPQPSEALQDRQRAVAPSPEPPNEGEQPENAPPAPGPAADNPNPTPPAAAPPRRSTRLAGGQADHYVPLEGAPVEAAMAAVAANPEKQYVLALATLDTDLQDDDPSVTIVAEFDPRQDGSMAIVARDPALDTPTAKQALAGPERSLWIAAMEAELAAFKAREVYDEQKVALPPGKRAIPLKWVLVVKRDEHGNVIKYKARLVARGDLQRAGSDYDETFSSTVRFSTVRTCFALAAINGWQVKQFDVSEAFLHGTLPSKFELYIQQIPGFVDVNAPCHAHRLRKSLYGLKQAGRLWNEKFVGHLRDMGFEQLASDSSLFVRRRGNNVAVLPIHVDDGLVFGNDDLGGIISDLSSRLSDSVKEEPVSLFLGVRIRDTADGYTMDQRHYVEALLEKYGFDAEGATHATPLPSKVDLEAFRAGDTPADSRYRALLGALIYLSTCTRPDIAFAVSALSRFAAQPAMRHWILLKRILRYLSATRSLGLRYSSSGGSTLVGWSDADWGADPDTRRSVSGYSFSLGGCSVSWSSKRQATVATSSTEAEYVALSGAAREAIWFRVLLNELGFQQEDATVIYADNRSAITLAKHPSSHHRTKHIAIAHHFTRERIASGELEVRWISTEELAADVMTKGLAMPKHRKFVEMLGMQDAHREGVCKKELLEGGAMRAVEWRWWRDESGARV